ncbi:oligosaccharide flippase family protein [Microbacterium thalli]|uniref:Oligosaccharide flippase family protein n=1 Tax=Microbacterium thalli TaxID=3027921 RepID=A0ABT5SKZ0_9MICO|nr:oligosaccharide flippase family protein [Microbacterium thalli]MDD7963507.1 oligosaccharide flippase family protein [Microbacterium thalli]
MNTRAAIRATLLGQWAKFATQMVGFVLLARILAPADFGIVAMVSPIVAFATLFADLGLSLAGIQARSLAQSQKSLLFYLNLVAGGFCACAVAAAAPILALFYGEPRVTAVAIALGGSLLLVGASVQSRVELTRNGRFKALATQDGVSALVAIVAAVAAAVLGAGYWALVVQSIAQPLVILAMAAIQARWLPGRPAHLRESASFLVFGGHTLLLQLLNLTSRSVDVMAIGRAGGPVELGLYSRSSQLISIIFQQVVSPLTRVTLPRLVRAESGTEFTTLVQQLQRAISYVLVGLLSAVIAVAPAACVVVLGPEWRGAGPIVQVLAIGAVFAALGYVHYWALLAKGKTGLLVLAELPGRVVMIAGSVLLAVYGGTAVATAIVCGQVVTFAMQVFAGRKIGSGWRTLGRTACMPICIFAVATVISIASQSVADSDLIKFSVGTAAWLLVTAAALIIPAVRRDLRRMLSSLRGPKKGND